MSHGAFIGLVGSRVGSVTAEASSGRWCSRQSFGVRAKLSTRQWGSARMSNSPNVTPETSAEDMPGTTVQQDERLSNESKNERGGLFGWLRGGSTGQKSSRMAAALRAYGLAAVISYGIFDAITYGVSLLLAVRGYVAAGKVITLRTLPQVLAIMWGINNFSRPLRIAGALAIAPIVDSKLVKPVLRLLGKAPRDPPLSNGNANATMGAGVRESKQPQEL